MSIETVQIVFTFAVVAAAIVSYALERVSLELTSIAVLVALIVFFHILPVPDGAGANALGVDRLLAGFASPALAAIMALMVMGQALFQTGAIETPARWIARRGARSPRLVFAATFLGAAALSAFMNNTPLVVVLIPAVTAIAARLGANAGRMLMPICFITTLGGMTTVVGSSTNLLVAGIAERGHAIQIGFFEPMMPGIFLVGAGAFYVMFIMPRLLGREDGAATGVSGPDGRQFITEIAVHEGHALFGARARAGLFAELQNMTVRLVQRGGRTFLPPFEDVTLGAGDIVVVAATRAAITEALAGRNPIIAHDTDASDGTAATRPSDLVLAEAMIAPASRLIGRRVHLAGLEDDVGAAVLGIRRHSRMTRRPVGELRLEAGDIILILAHHDEIGQVSANRDILLLEWTQSEMPRIHVAGRAVAILAATLAVAAGELAPISLAALCGALAMIAAGCLNIRQAARAFDRRIYLLVGASLALAAPLEVTGAAGLVARAVIDLVAGWGMFGLLAALFLVIALFTNVLSNHATAALFTPIALAAAAQTGADPGIFLLTVIYAANCSFATPIAYQTNLLVMGPGRYRFADFARAGTPLILIVWLVYCLSLSWYFGL